MSRSVSALEGIWIKRVHRGIMDPVSWATLVKNRGLLVNADQGRRRQVTIIEREVWAALMLQVGANLPPQARRANLMVSGTPLVGTHGRVLRIGTCRIRVRGETKPCEMVEALHPGLRAAMYPDWRGGAFGEVLDDGEIALGDLVQWENTDSTDPRITRMV